MNNELRIMNFTPALKNKVANGVLHRKGALSPDLSTIPHFHSIIRHSINESKNKKLFSGGEKC